MPNFPYTAWSLAQARSIVRRELSDPNGRWWADTELNRYVDAWQNELQQRFEFVWGSSTLVTATSTVGTASFVPGILRLDAIYWNGYRLSGRLWQDANELIYDWQNINGTAISNPQFVYQQNATSFVLWPQLTTSGTLTLEYPRKISIDIDGIAIPAWTQWTVKYYCAWRAYLRLGHTNDLKRAMRYKAKYEKAVLALRELYDHFLPERYRRLKLGQKYEYDILCPNPAIDGLIAPTIGKFRDFNSMGGGVSGVIDGSNRTFGIPIFPQAQKVFVNGIYRDIGNDYTIVGNAITFVVPPPADSLIVVLAFVS